MNCEESNGASLEATETAGIFKVTGGLTAVATDSAGETYVSDNGTLTVPAEHIMYSIPRIRIIRNNGRAR